MHSLIWVFYMMVTEEKLKGGLYFSDSTFQFAIKITADTIFGKTTRLRINLQIRFSAEVLHPHWIIVEAVKNIFKHFVDNGPLNYLVSSKLSQDHLETFFGRIRARLGLNNQTVPQECKLLFLFFLKYWISNFDLDYNRFCKYQFKKDDFLFKFLTSFQRTETFK